MKQLTLLLLGVFAIVVSSEAAPLPTLERRGAAAQLIVDGQPWLIRGGEVANTASSSLAYMDTVWPKLTRLNLNTVLVAIAWAWVEPAEGKFDFALVDGLLAGARANNQRVIFLWFGSWKNGISSFVPAWVKADQARFPRVRVAGGQSVEILSPLSATALAADTRAYVKFMEHLREADPQRTTLMIQLQNEVGVLGDSRDRSDAANAAFAGAVPAELMKYLAAHQAGLAPALAKLWAEAGGKTAGTWTEVFGTSPATDELFMAWHYAKFMGGMTAAGKAVYPLPVFTNTWIVQPEDKGPGDYPSGGPQPLSLDVWKAGAPAIDLNCPDIYLPNFDEQVASFQRPDNPVFVPESRGDAGGAANAFYAIGAHASLGYSPFGIDNTGRLVVLRPEPGAPAPTELEGLPLAKAYAVLRDLTPLILEHQQKGTIRAAWLTTTKPRQEIALGNHTLTVELRKNRRTGKLSAELGYAMVCGLGPDDYLVAGTDVQVTFTPRPPGAPIAGIADAEAGEVRDGRWVPGRKMSGDDILVDYNLAKAAAANQSGSGLMFGPDGPTLQRVKLYRYR
ncbi:MAG: DUF5597 domain-containing protein [Lacunisphaera sp.]|nr:DUF5597 domain-containing protein [Lacunisphaera sp.]